MKKITFILCMALLVLVGCKPKNQCTINGLLADEALEGMMVYLYETSDNSLLDSAVITNGVFTFKETVEQPALVSLKAAGENMAYSLIVVMEPGTIHADMITDSLSGTPLNEELYKFTTYEKQISEGLQPAYMKILAMSDTAAQAVAMEEFMANYNKLMEEYAQTVNQYYEQNKGNILGVYFLGNMEELSFEQMNALLEGAAPVVVNNPMVQDQLSMLKKRDQTKVGNPFVDVDVIDYQTGNPAKLSDYVAGKIALVDFWASWCRPCRGEIPNIANVYEKYGDKIAVISLNVWDKPEAQAMAIQEMNMNWIQLSDTTRKATEEYGVNGIPQIILIGADGTILARDLREKAIEEAVVKALE